MSTFTKPRLIGISGSLRQNSFNTAILASVAADIADRAVLEIVPLNDIPLYSEDIDTATPPHAVVRLRAAIANADGVVIASPEYNYGISGVLKNALDWASRPYGKSAFNGKPVLTATSSVAFTGGVRAQAQLTETLGAIGAHVLIRPQIVVPAVHEKLKDGKLDHATLGFVRAGIDDLLKAVQANRAVLKAAA
ncbi:MAG: NAD(P)H-dependent oxidoreductase [Rhodospirillaceae bacterium]|nr:NAD(P)H-dependent oxidoreductase [Rhodospirillaceae bacterium]